MQRLPRQVKSSAHASGSTLDGSMRDSLFRKGEQLKGEVGLGDEHLGGTGLTRMRVWPLNPFLLITHTLLGGNEYTSKYIASEESVWQVL